MSGKRLHTGPYALLISVTYVVILTACVDAYETNKDGICQSMDIRNNAQSLMPLKDCEVIEGVLQISLMERNTPESYNNISFPKLREITGYLIIYRLKGLKSIGQLFPNLSVIRGTQLFKDYALIIYELDNLETIGLKSLTNIERGSVRIEMNLMLCYANTIDWAAIAPSNPSANYVGANRDPKFCGLCPNEMLQSAESQCPKDSKTQKPLCWDENTCQKVCPARCGSSPCMANGTCCDPNCLGGCDGPRATDCHVCKHFSLGIGSDKRCAQDCPAHLYKHYNRRCITESECRSLPPPKHYETDKNFTSYKLINRTCMFECPVNFHEVGSGENATCVPCPGVCTRYCSGVKVDSLEKAEKLKGCTHIRGSLDISIKGGTHVMRELNESLGHIVEIEDTLKVTRSFALTTLYFLSSLKTIKGKHLEASKQTLVIFDNPNLEKLWDWKVHGNINIEKGKVFIHYNPKLCYGEILPLKNMTVKPFDQYDVSDLTNGDRNVCEKEVLNLKVSQISNNNCVLQWDHFCQDDSRVLLGYSVYYIKTNQNITIYDGRDACSDAWSVMDKTIQSTLNSTGLTSLDPWACAHLAPVFAPLTRLEPYTRYAVYVKTYTTFTDRKGAQSPIVYFTTKAGTPTKPTFALVESISPHDLFVKWIPPQSANGNLSQYWIEVKLIENNVSESFTGVSYCMSPSEVRTPATHRIMFTTSTPPSKISEEGGSDRCKCSASESTVFSLESQALASDAIRFENELQNKIYIRWKYLPPRNRRSLQDVLKKDASDLAPMNRTNITDYDGFLTNEVLMTDGNTNSVVVTGLRNYGYYSVSLWACRSLEANEVDPNLDRCSPKIDANIYTKPLPSADRVESVMADILPGNKSTSEVRVTWKPPTNPNGALLAYRIRHTLMHADSNDVRAPVTCISSGDFLSNQRIYVLRNLAPGNYSITVMAITVAGSGPWSASAYVVIPERSGREWVGGIAAGLVGVVGVIAVAIWWARRAARPRLHDKLFASVNPEYVASVYVPDEWEIERENIQLVKELGQGSFGMVYEGIAKGIQKDVAETRCAVKTVNMHATERERIDFLNEASLMKAFDTAHVVRLLGVVSRGQPTLVVMELMRLGDLKSFLRARRQDEDKPAQQPQPTLQQIRQMAIEIADGMAYLSAKKFVHRDLAARNCMVAEDLTVKVGDFGMTRDIYETDYYRKGSKGLLPVRWMSPESLKDGVFSSHSDVWSYGVVLWEMATLAMQPYQGLSNEQVLRYVVEGGVMERPSQCPEGLYELMRWCWRHRPDERPAFLQLVAELAPHAEPRFRQRSFFHTPLAQELYSQYSSACGTTEQIEETNRGAPGSRLASWVRSVTRSHTPEPEQRALVLKPQTNGIRRAAEPC